MMQKSNPLSSDSSGDIEISDFSMLPTEPLVSVCMITYNHAAYLGEALDSVLMQRVDFPYEICLGEDGSDDGTREICLKYVKSHPDRFRLFLRDRGNPARTRYKAPWMHNAIETFSACRGKYVALLDGDDYWSNPHKLRRQVECMEADQDVTLCGHYSVTASETMPWRARVFPQLPVHFFTLSDMLRYDVKNVHTSTILVRRNESMKWDAYADSHFTDYPIMIGHLLKGKGVVLPFIMSVYRVNEKSVFAPLSEVKKLRRVVELWEMIRNAVGTDYDQAVDVGLVRVLASLVAELRKVGQFGEAIRCFRDAVRVVRRLHGKGIYGRALMWLIVLESLLSPRFRGLRRRFLLSWHAKRGLSHSK